MTHTQAQPRKFSWRKRKPNTAVHIPLSSRMDWLNALAGLVGVLLCLVIALTFVDILQVHASSNTANHYSQWQMPEPPQKAKLNVASALSSKPWTEQSVDDVGRLFRLSPTPSLNSRTPTPVNRSATVLKQAHSPLRPWQLEMHMPAVSAETRHYWLHRAQAAQQAGYTDLAIRYFRDVLQADPAQVEALHGLYSLLHQQGIHAAADEIQQQQCYFYPDDDCHPSETFAP